MEQKTAAAYIRVSTDDQIEFSPESQIKRIQEYAEQHSLILPEEFIFMDEGISGRSTKKRKNFMKMIGIAKLKPKRFDVILLWKFSRFARNRQDSILYKTMLRKECGIDVISITEQLSDDPTSILIEALIEAMDEYYSINLSEEVKRGMTERFSRGLIMTAPSFGYKMEGGNYVIDEERAKIVRMIFSDFIAGMPIIQIARKINAMGVKSKHGNQFENRTVEYILHNPVYIGKIRWTPNGRDNKDYFHIGDGPVVTDGTHEAIISEEVFFQAEQRFAEIKAKYTKYSRKEPGCFMLKGLVKCSSCGATLCGLEKRDGKYISIQCNRYTHGKCGISHYISLKKLNEAVLEQLESDLDGTLVDISVSPGQKSSVNMNTIQMLINKEQRKLQLIYDAYVAEVDTLEEYKTQKEKIMCRIRELEKQLPTKEPDAPGETAKRLKRQMKRMIPQLRSPDISEEVKSELLRSVLTKIVFDRKNGVFQLHYHL